MNACEEEKEGEGRIITMDIWLNEWTNEGMNDPPEDSRQNNIRLLLTDNGEVGQVHESRSHHVLVIALNNLYSITCTSVLNNLYKCTQ